MLKNWMTSGAGIVLILVSLFKCYVDGMIDLHCVMGVLSGIGLVAAKDKNVTGGSIPQTPESVERVEEDKGKVLP